MEETRKEYDPKVRGIRAIVFADRTSGAGVDPQDSKARQKVEEREEEAALRMLKDPRGLSKLSKEAEDVERQLQECQRSLDRLETIEEIILEARRKFLPTREGAIAELPNKVLFEFVVQKNDDFYLFHGFLDRAMREEGRDRLDYRATERRLHEIMKACKAALERRKALLEIKLTAQHRILGERSLDPVTKDLVTEAYKIMDQATTYWKMCENLQDVAVGPHQVRLSQAAISARFVQAGFRVPGAKGNPKKNRASNFERVKERIRRYKEEGIMPARPDT